VPLGRAGLTSGFNQDYLVSAKLSTVTISANKLPSIGQTLELFSALSSGIFDQSMVSLHVFAAIDDEWQEFFGVSALQSSDFEPLLQFHNLEMLHHQQIRELWV
jgi:hypothetical protein